MKFKGQSVANTNVEYVVIPRGETRIVFIAKPVVSMDPFNELYLEPQPPSIEFPEHTGRAPEKDFTDSRYLGRVKDYCEARYYWMVLTSLRDSPDIQWETIDMAKPDTYKNFEIELQNAEFLPIEINKIRNAVSIVNALDERQMEEARKSFLASLQAPVTL